MSDIQRCSNVEHEDAMQLEHVELLNVIIDWNWRRWLPESETQSGRTRMETDEIGKAKEEEKARRLKKKTEESLWIRVREEPKAKEKTLTLIQVSKFKVKRHRSLLSFNYTWLLNIQFSQVFKLQSEDWRRNAKRHNWAAQLKNEESHLDGSTGSRACEPLDYTVRPQVWARLYLCKKFKLKFVFARLISGVFKLSLNLNQINSDSNPALLQLSWHSTVAFLPRWVPATQKYVIISILSQHDDLYIGTQI